VSRASLASTSIDRTADYYAKPEHRMRPDFACRVSRGMELQTSWPWLSTPEPANDPDDYMKGEA
jgi:hypothetical protein